GSYVAPDTLPPKVLDGLPRGRLSSTMDVGRWRRFLPSVAPSHVWSSNWLPSEHSVEPQYQANPLATVATAPYVVPIQKPVLRYVSPYVIQPSPSAFGESHRAVERGG